MTNSKTLTVGTYNLKMFANDTSGNEISASIIIKVEESTTTETTSSTETTSTTETDTSNPSDPFDTSIVGYPNGFVVFALGALAWVLSRKRRVIRS